MAVHDRVSELAHLESASVPVVSVYLDTHWADEHARERARVFLKTELRQARAHEPAPHPADLEWIETEGSRLLDQAEHADARGVALFACAALSLREVLPLRQPFANRFEIASAPFVLPLAAAAGDLLPAVIVFADAESARLIPVDAAGAGTEEVLSSEVPGHHSRGGWAQLAQSRYQRHTRDHRDHHFTAVAEAVAALARAHGVERVVLAGDPRNVAAFRMRLPERIAALVVGTIEGARHEPAGTLVARAAALLRHAEEQRHAADVDAVLTAAAKGDHAVASADGVLDVVNRGAVRHLYIARDYRCAGRRCTRCGALARGNAPACPFCRGATTDASLDRAICERVLAAGGRIDVIDDHAGLARAGGIAALLRSER